MANPIAGIFPRARGQEVGIVVQDDVNGIELAFNAMLSFNSENIGEILSQGFLGETTERKDDIFKGVKADFECEIDRQDALKFQDLVKQRQQRIRPSLVFNIARQINFANGDAPDTLFPDVKFGSITTSIASRADYVKMKFAVETDDTSTSYT